MSGPLYIFVLYLLYGLAFFAMGMAIISRDTRSSNLEIARPLWLFALFAFTHAFHEWSELYLLLQQRFIEPDFLLRIKLTKLGPVFVSFCFLLLFGLVLLRIVFPRQRRLLLLVPGVLFPVLLVSLLRAGPEKSVAFLQYADFLLRNFVGFPAGLIAGLGMVAYSKAVRHLSRRGARNFMISGFCLMIYGVLAGLVPSRTVLFAGAQIEVFRGLSAVAILHFLMNALHVFDVERKALIEERLQRFAQSEKINSLGKLAAGIAHEINNPLANVSLNVEMLKGDLQQEGCFNSHEKRFTAIERNIGRASKIARELLDFSRTREAELATTDLNEVVRNTLELLGPRSDFNLRLNLGEIQPIMAIPWKLEEVFLNLILNAIEATPPGGTITISTAAREGAVIAEVADTGVGIPRECLNSIFDPFFTTKEVGKGTGLGLSICLGIMKLHGGGLEVKSTGPAGTIMALIFPASGGANA